MSQPLEPKHLPPQSVLFNHRKYCPVCQCERCGAIGLYYDMHPVSPCPECGGKVHKIGAAKWGREYTGETRKLLWGLITIRETTERWIFAKNEERKED